MQSFEHDQVTSFAEVRRKVGRGDMLIAGGIVPLMRDGLVAPRKLVNLKTVRSRSWPTSRRTPPCAAGIPRSPPPAMR